MLNSFEPPSGPGNSAKAQWFFQAPRHYIINSYKTFAVGADEGRGQDHGNHMALVLMLKLM